MNHLNHWDGRECFFDLLLFVVSNKNIYKKQAIVSQRAEQAILQASVNDWENAAKVNQLMHFSDTNMYTGQLTGPYPNSRSSQFSLT